MNLRSSKKGQALDVISIVVFLFVFGLMIFISLKLMDGIVEGFTEAGLYTGVLAETGQKFVNALLFFDKVIIFFAVGLIIGMAIVSFRLRTSPIGFLISFISSAFLGVIAYYFNFIFLESVSNSALSSLQGSFPLTMIVCTNLHWIALTALVVGVIGLFAKRPQDIEEVSQIEE